MEAFCSTTLLTVLQKLKNSTTILVDFHIKPVKLGPMNRVANSVVWLSTRSSNFLQVLLPATPFMARKRQLSENHQDNPKKMEFMEGGAVCVEKSQSDKKSYKVVTLENCLKVLLVSDPSAIVEATHEDSEEDELSEVRRIVHSVF
jgi:hypothetical protein